MENIIKIIAKRDEVTYNDARNIIQDFLDEAEYYIENCEYDELQDLLMDMLGLEMDYLPEILLN